MIIIIASNYRQNTNRDIVYGIVQNILQNSAGSAVYKIEIKTKTEM